MTHKLDIYIDKSLPGCPLFGPGGLMTNETVYNTLSSLHEKLHLSDKEVKRLENFSDELEEKHNMLMEKNIQVERERNDLIHQLANLQKKLK